jgi:uncharacterized protein (DUF433 family)
VTSRTIPASLGEGATTEEILRDFPTLTEVDVRAVVAFAAASAQEICRSPKHAYGEDQAG